MAGIADAGGVVGEVAAGAREQAAGVVKVQGCSDAAEPAGKAVGTGAQAGEAVGITEQTFPAGGVSELPGGALNAAVVGAVNEEVGDVVGSGAVVALSGRASEAGEAASRAVVTSQVCQSAVLAGGAGVDARLLAEEVSHTMQALATLAHRVAGASGTYFIADRTLRCQVIGELARVAASRTGIFADLQEVLRAVGEGVALGAGVEPWSKAGLAARGAL